MSAVQESLSTLNRNVKWETVAWSGSTVNPTLVTVTLGTPGPELTGPLRMVPYQSPALGLTAGDGTTVKLSVTLLALLDSLRRYWPAVIGFDPNTLLTVIVCEPRKLPRLLALRTVDHALPVFRDRT